MPDLLTDDDTEFLRAAHWAHRERHDEPQEVQVARKADHDLVARRARDGWRKPTRDERRLAGHYRSVVLDHEHRVVDAYRAATAAPPAT